MPVTLNRVFTDLLDRREAELRAFLHASAQAAVGTAGEPHEMMDFKDVAAQESLAAVDAAAEEQAARELAQVRAALKRVDDGSYGMCLDCGDPIEERRLMALPATPFCTSCQAVNERLPAARR